MIKTLAFLLAAVASAVHADPDGSPICSTDTAALAAGMGGTDDPSLGWSISVSAPTYATGDNLTVSILPKEGAQAATFKGLLLYARTTTNYQVGKWELVNDDFKTLDDKCSQYGAPGATLTQSSSADKPAPTDLTWIAPDSSVGAVEFRGIVVTSSQSTWMMLPPVIVTSGGDPAAGNGTAGEAPVEQGKQEEDPLKDGAPSGLAPTLTAGFVASALAALVM